MDETQEMLGKPDVSLAGLQMWVHSCANDSIKYTVHCGEKGADVWIRQAWIEIYHMESWLKETKTLYTTLKGKAQLSNYEPEFHVRLEGGGSGHIGMTVDITPDIVNQKHQFVFEIDQSYLKPFISQCELLLEKFPVKGKEQMKAVQSKTPQIHAGKKPWWKLW